MNTVKLTVEKCLHCSKATTVVPVEPYYPPPEPEGLWLRTMDENFEEQTIGVLCKDCFNSLVKDSKISFGGFSDGDGSWPSIDAMVDGENWHEVIRFPQFMLPQETGLEEDDEL